MLMVYAITRAGEHGWSNRVTLGLLALAALLMVAFVAIEHRSAAPLLPLRIFRSRVVSAANATMLAIGAVSFSQFFLLTLYLQDVLGYSAIKTGVAFIGITLVIAVTANRGAGADDPVRAAARADDAEMLLSAASAAVYARMPVHGHYFWDVFPGFVLGGLGLALSFVPVTIAALSGSLPADAGIASGLINTTRQIGGSLGVAAVTTIAATATAHYASSHPGTAGTGLALTQGFHVALYLLVGLALAGALLTAVFLRPKPVVAAVEEESLRLEGGRMTATRWSYQHEVESLLTQIRAQVAELYRLKVAGVRGAALRDRKRRLAETRGRLAAVVGGQAADMQQAA